MIESGSQRFALIILSRILGSLAHLEKKCGSSKVSPKLVLIQGNEYNCPREHDPVTFTECCDNGGCCEKKSLFSQFDEELIMITGVTVITICVILMAFLVICCFWSKCLCYSTCRSDYTSSETIIYSLSKDNHTVLMPNQNGCNQFTPCLIKMKKVEEF